MARPRRLIPLHFEVLPAPGGRWTPSRKALVIRALNSGQISIDDALERYGLSVEEIMTWDNRLRSGGRDDLRASAYHLDRIRTKRPVSS